MSKLKLIFGPRVASIAPPDPIPNPNPGGIEDLDPLRFKPIALTTTVYRTMLVDAGDEVIDLTREVLHPGSPQAVLFQISGTHWDNWKQDTVGLLTAKTSIRNSLKATTQTLNIKALNGAGWSAEVVLTIIVKADADCRFCDFASGSDANNGTTPALAWKHAPRSYPFTGTQVTLGAGKVLFFKAGKHRYSLGDTIDSNFGTLPHAGSAGDPFVYNAWGWGLGRGRIMGDVVEAGTPQSVTQAEVGGNPNWASLKKIAIGTAIERWQRFFSGDVMLNPAQYPTPANPRLSEGMQDSTNSQGAFTGIAMTSSSGTSPRAFQTGGASGTITWVDARLASKLGNVASVTVEGRKVVYWAAGNYAAYATITSYDFATSTITATPVVATALYDAGNGFTSLGVVLHPALIDGVGQYAVSADGLTVYYWEPNADEKSVSRRKCGMPVGGVDHVRVLGFEFSRFAGNGNALGSAIARSAGRVTVDVDISNLRIEHCAMADGGGVISNTGTTDIGWADSNIERIDVGFCPYSGFFRSGAQFVASSASTLTEAEVGALAKGKLRYCYVEDYAMSGTSILLVLSRHIEIAGNVHRAGLSPHGGGLKLYTDNPAHFIERCLVRHNLFAGLDRCLAFSGDDDDRGDWFRRNIWLGDASAGGTFPVGRDPGSNRSGEIMAFVPGGSYPYAYNQAQGANADTIRGSVIAGASRGPVLASCSYDIQNCYFPDTSVLENDGADRIFANNEVETGVVEWDWLNDNMPTKWHDEIRDRDGAGPIGVYWEIAA